MNRSIGLVSVALAMLAGPAAAVVATPAVIGPTAPSQLVVLRVSGAGTACIGQGGGQEADVQVFPDGSTGLYTPPAGAAFVITGIDWGTNGGAAGEFTPIAIRLTSPHPPSSLVFATGAVADVAGKTWGSAVVPNVAVAPGVKICVGGNLNQVAIHGYHTPYK
jgi:hypothetical protein